MLLYLKNVLILKMLLMLLDLHLPKGGGDHFSANKQLGI